MSEPIAPPGAGIDPGAGATAPLNTPDEPPTGKGGFKVRVTIGGALHKDFRFDKDTVTIGREPGSDICLDNQLVSRRHAAIVRNGDYYALLDKKSENRCFVNGKPAEEMLLLNNGDEILVGKFTLRFEATHATGMFPIPSDLSGDIDKLGGATLKMTEKQQSRLVKERGRVKGFVLVPRRGGPDHKVLVTELFQIGKDGDCDFRLQGFWAPRKAALVVRGLDDYRLVNVGANRNAVELNGKQLLNVAVLKDGDVFMVSGNTFRFSVPEAETKEH